MPNYYRDVEKYYNNRMTSKIRWSNSLLIAIKKWLDANKSALTASANFELAKLGLLNDTSSYHDFCQIIFKAYHTDNSDFKDKVINYDGYEVFSSVLKFLQANNVLNKDTVELLLSNNYFKDKASESYFENIFSMLENLKKYSLLTTDNIKEIFGNNKTSQSINNTLFLLTLTRMGGLANNDWGIDKEYHKILFETAVFLSESELEQKKLATIFNNFKDILLSKENRKLFANENQIKIFINHFIKIEFDKNNLSQAIDLIGFLSSKKLITDENLNLFCKTLIKDSAAIVLNKDLLEQSVSAEDLSTRLLLCKYDFKALSNESVTKIKQLISELGNEFVTLLEIYSKLMGDKFTESLLAIAESENKKQTFLEKLITCIDSRAYTNIDTEEKSKIVELLKNSDSLYENYILCKIVLDKSYSFSGLNAEKIFQESVVNNGIKITFVDSESEKLSGVNPKGIFSSFMQSTSGKKTSSLLWKQTPDEKYSKASIAIKSALDKILDDLKSSVTINKSNLELVPEQLLNQFKGKLAVLEEFNKKTDQLIDSYSHDDVIHQVASASFNRNEEIQYNLLFKEIIKEYIQQKLILPKEEKPRKEIVEKFKKIAAENSQETSLLETLLIKEKEGSFKNSMNAIFTQAQQQQHQVN